MKIFNKFINKNPLLKIFITSLINLPTPSRINYLWNFGSILGLFLIIQIISGLFLSIHYCPNINFAFNRIIHIIKDVNIGWFIRLIHINGASFFFLSIYIHVARGIYYFSFHLFKVWLIGIIILLLSIATAFLGYVLPWGQISFWGATVITNLLSAIPYLGQYLVEWIWGGFSINNATLNRFYSFHFILPIIILSIVILHLFFLHLRFSHNSIGIRRLLYILPFNPYFIIKDIFGYIIILISFFIISIKFPYILRDPDNFILANPIITPEHIKPEWYFLFAYAILRSIPNKLGGVIFLLISILILIILPILNFNKINSCKFYYLNKIIFWIFIISFIILTWLGGQTIEYPYILLTQLFSFIYFSYFFIIPIINFYWDKFIY